jgi:Asp-tRNA(Asn)/Glu-tRNA(Gln) amidotransferase A subunit family amidase
MVGLAADFDTVGLLTRTPDRLQAAARVLVGPDSTTLSGEVIELADTGFDLAVMAQAFITHQGYQAWQLHGPWIESHPDALRGTAAERFQVARKITEDDDTAARLVLDQVRDEIDKRLGTGVLSLPSAASAAPRVWAAGPELQAIRIANLQLTCIAGISGRPALSVPTFETPAGPIGQCYVGPAGSDVALVTWATARTA